MTTALIKIALAGADQVRSGLSSVEKSLDSVSVSAKSMLGPLALLAAGTAALSKVTSVQREFDVLNSSLITVTGSSARAQKEFEWIKQFAATTPFQLTEVTGAFVKMKSLGLDASAKSLASYGNTASAMGKSLNQMIEAVADASTGEFERLKEFGIKANKEGDKVKLTFQGVSTSIGNNSAEITKYLEAIGNNQFAGAMAVRAQTLDGAISNLMDTWDALFRSISSQGAGNLIHDSVKLATGSVQDLTSVIDALSSASEKNSKDTGLMGIAQSSLATVFETVAVLGVNLKYVLVGIGNEIGGIAAQAAAVARLDFSGAKAIGEAMRADAVQARAEVDSASNKILTARAVAKSLEGASALNEPRFARAMQATEEAAKKAKPSVSALGAAAKKAADDFDKLIDSLAKSVIAANIESQGFKGAQAEFLKLAASPEWAKYTNVQRAQAAALFETKIASEQAQEAMSALKKTQEDANKAHLDSIKALNESVQSVIERVQAMRDEEQAILLAEQLTISLAAATEMLTIKRLEDKQVQALGNEEAVLAIQNEINARRELLTLIGGKDARDAAKKALDEANKLRNKDLEEQQKYHDQIAQSFTDRLMQGGRSVRDYLKDLFRTLVLRPILQPIGAAAASLLTGGGLPGLASAQGASGGGLLSSLLGGGGSNPFAGIFNAQGTGIASAISGGFSAGFGGLKGSIGSLFGAAGTGTTLAGSLSAGSIALSSGNILGGLSTFAGALGPIALGISAISSLFKKKVVDSGIQGEFGGEAGFSGTAYTTKKSFFGGRKDSLSALDDELRLTLAAQFGAIKATVIEQAKSLNLGVDGVDAVRAGFRLSTAGLNEEQVKKALEAELANAADSVARAVLGSMRTFEESITRTVSVGAGDSREDTLVSEIVQRSEYVASALAKAGESASETLERLSVSLVSVNDLFDRLGVVALEASVLGGDRASKLVDLVGGRESFTQLGGTFYDKFFTDQEKLSRSLAGLQSQLVGIGADPNLDRAGYRATLEAAAAGGNDALVASLLKLAPAFDAVASATESAQAQFNQLLGTINQQSITLQDEILGLQGGDVQAAQVAREYAQAIAGRTDAEQVLIKAQFDKRASLIAERDALVASIAQSKAAQEASEAAAQAVAQASQAASELLRAVAQERFDLEGQLLAATGQTVALRQRELDAIDATNRSLKQRLFDLQDFDSFIGQVRQGLGQQNTAISATLTSSTAALSASAQAAGSLAQEMESLMAGLGNSISQLQLGTIDAAAGLYDQARRFITSSAQQARLGLGLPASADLLKATERAMAGLDKKFFNTRAEVDFERLRLAGELQELQDAAGAQKSVAEQQLDAANVQIAALQSQSESLQRIAQSLDGLSRAQLLARAPSLRGTGATDSLASLGGSSGIYASSGGATGVITGSQSLVIGKDGQSNFELSYIRDFVGQRLGTEAGLREIYQEAVKFGVSSSMLDDIMQFPRGTSLKTAQDLGLPAFANGGLHKGGFAIVGERGPEIADIGPSRIYSNAQSRSLMDTSRLESLVEGMSARIKELESQIFQGNVIATRTHSLLDTVTQGGNALRTVDV